MAKANKYYQVSYHCVKSKPKPVGTLCETVSNMNLRVILLEGMRAGGFIHQLPSSLVGSFINSLALLAFHVWVQNGLWWSEKALGPRDADCSSWKLSGHAM